MNAATAKALVAAYIGATSLDGRDIDLTVDLASRRPSEWLFLEDGPLTSVTALTLNGGVVVHYSTLPTFEVKLSQVYGAGSLRLVGRLGWDNLPAQIQAAVDLTMAHYAAQSPGVKQETVARRSRTFSDTDTTGLPQHVQALLAPYRRLFL